MSFGSYEPHMCQVSFQVLPSVHLYGIDNELMAIKGFEDGKRLILLNNMECVIMKTEEEINHEIKRLDKLLYKKPKNKNEKEFNAHTSGMILKLKWVLM